MTAPGQKVGPLTQADLQAIWEGAVDSGFSGGLEAAGEGAGFEAYTQMFAQFARASQAVDTTTQALYILPSSGQSASPAPRAQKATVSLTFARSPQSAYINWPLVIAAGTVFVGEQAFEWGLSPGADGALVQTGRRYLVTQTLVLPPGDAGPYSVQATAEFAGYGYNNPLGAYTTAGGVSVPGAINLISQPGTGYSHDRASLVVSPAGAPLTPPTSGTPAPPAAVAQLVAVNEPDMFLPQHVGQYVLMTAGANAGKVGRITGYAAPGVLAPGSAVILAYDQAVEATGVSGAFSAGEVLTFKSGGNVVAQAVLVGTAPAPSGATRIVYTLLDGAVAAGNSVKGLASAASGTVSTLLSTPTWTAAGSLPPNPNLSPGSGENWRVLDWVTDLQVSVQNKLQPSGGTSGMLEELAYERGMAAGNGEGADALRARVAAPSDTISPNAIRRAIVRALGGTTGTFLDTQTGLDGFFYDRADAGGCFYDTCVLVMTQTGFTSVQPGDRLRWLDASGLLIANGYYGGSQSAGTFNFVLRGGPASPLPRRLTFQTGDTVVDDTRPSLPPAVLSAVLTPTCFTGMQAQVYLDFLSFRGYFLAEVPPGGQGEFGFAYGSTAANHDGTGFYDQLGLATGFYDGKPVVTDGTLATLHRELERVEAGGVDFDIVVLPTAFTPGATPGAIGWWRADKNIATATGVSSWGDILGLSSAAVQASGPAQPIWNAADANFGGQASILGNGTQWLVSSSVPLAGSNTIFVWMVARLVSGAANNELLALNSSGSIWEIRCTGASNGQPQVVNNVSGQFGAQWGASIIGSTKALAAYTSGTTTSVSVDNVSPVTSPVTAGTFATSSCAFFGRAGSLLSNLAIAEILITNQLPSVSTLAQLQAYAVTRYGAI
jgi:hypothetical protein